MTRAFQILVMTILFGLICVAGYYGFLRRMEVMAADWARLKALFPWVTGALGIILGAFGLMVLVEKTKDQWKAVKLKFGKGNVKKIL